jgi:hypothetical protein
MINGIKLLADDPAFFRFIFSAVCAAEENKRRK